MRREKKTGCANLWNSCECGARHRLNGGFGAAAVKANTPYCVSAFQPCAHRLFERVELSNVLCSWCPPVVRAMSSSETIGRSLVRRAMIAYALCCAHCSCCSRSESPKEKRGLASLFSTRDGYNRYKCNSIN